MEAKERKGFETEVNGRRLRRYRGKRAFLPFSITTTEPPTFNPGAPGGPVEPVEPASP